MQWLQARQPSPPLRGLGSLGGTGGMARIPSDFKINEMLDLFDVGDPRASPPANPDAASGMADG